MSSRVIKMLPGLAVSALAIIWLIFAEDWSSIGHKLANINFLPLLVAVPIITFHFWLRALRWHYLLPGEERLKTRILFDGIILSNFASFVLPLRAGEFIRAFFLARLSPHSFMTAFSSVVTERLFDLLAVLITFSIILRWNVVLPEWAHHGGDILTLLAIMLIAFIIAGIYARSLLLKVIELALTPFPATIRSPVENITEQLLEAVKTLHSFPRLFMIVLLTTLCWLANYLLFYVFLFTIDAPASPLLAVTAAVIIALAVAAPSAPGFIGVFEAAGRAAFVALNFPGDTGVTYALIMHIFQYVLFVAYGSYILMVYDLRLKDLMPGKKKNQNKQVDVQNA